MSQFKMRSSALQPEVFFKHKQYFDSSLIYLLERQYKQISKYKEQVGKQTVSLESKENIINDLRFELKDTKIINTNLKQMLAEKDIDVTKIINDFEKQIKKQEKQIEDELVKSYKDNAKLHDENERLKKEIEKLRRENNKYRSSATKTSSNSSIPPTQDPYHTRVQTRVKTDRVKGGQKGHALHRSKLEKDVDEVIIREVKKQPIGAQPIKNEDGVVLYYVTQEIDLVFEAKMIETRYYIKEDGEDVDDKTMNTYKINPVAYSTDFKSIVLYLNSRGTIPLERLCQMLEEMSDNTIHLKPSTIVKWQAMFTCKSEVQRAKILEQICKQPVVHVDESGWKINGTMAWLHVVSGGNNAYFQIAHERSKYEEGPITYLDGYSGYLMHDHFVPYYQLKDCIHVACNAHILRYLKGGVDLENSVACANMISLLNEMLSRKQALQKQGQTEMSETERKGYEDQYHQILDEELKQYDEKNPNIAKKYEAEYIKLFRRMKRDSEEHLYFIRDFIVPFTNNQAERMIRPAKAKKKISGQSSNVKTANYFSALQTINQTSILKKENVLSKIKQILS